MNTRTITISFYGLGVLVLAGLILFAPKTSSDIDVVSEVSVETNDVPEESLTETTLTADAPVSQEIEEEHKRAVVAAAYTLSGESVTGWKSEKRWPIASITKLMSALVIRRHFDPDEEIRISTNSTGIYGTAGEFSENEVFKLEDLIKAMMLVSSNDAAYALGEHYGYRKLIGEMNEMAVVIGMKNTKFADPTGLSVENQSTADDIAKLVRYIYENDRGLLDLTTHPTEIITNLNTGLSRQLVSINNFAGRPDFLGGKTGRLPEADGNLVSVFKVPGYEEPIIIVVLGSQDRFKETEEILINL